MPQINDCFSVISTKGEQLSSLPVSSPEEGSTLIGKNLLQEERNSFSRVNPY